jgi:hypothetical protein
MRSYPKSIIPSVICSLVSFALLLAVTVSSPLQPSIYFLKLQTGPNEPNPFPSNTTVTFGVFGNTNSTCHVGYIPADWSGTGVRDPTVDQASLNSITYALILHPVAAFLAAITFGFVMIGLCSRAGAVFGTIFSALMALTTIIVCVVDLVLFSILKSDFIQPPYNERKTSYGPALWLTMGALVACVITLASASYTSFSHNLYPRKWEHKEQY